MKAVRLRFFSEEDLEVLLCRVWVRLERSGRESPVGIRIVQERGDNCFVVLSFGCPGTAQMILSAFGNRCLRRGGEIRIFPPYRIPGRGGRRRASAPRGFCARLAHGASGTGSQRGLT